MAEIFVFSKKIFKSKNARSCSPIVDLGPSVFFMVKGRLSTNITSVISLHVTLSGCKNMRRRCRTFSLID